MTKLEVKIQWGMCYRTSKAIDLIAFGKIRVQGLHVQLTQAGLSRNSIFRNSQKKIYFVSWSQICFNRSFFLVFFIFLPRDLCVHLPSELKVFLAPYQYHFSFSFQHLYFPKQLILDIKWTLIGKMSIFRWDLLKNIFQIPL